MIDLDQASLDRVLPSAPGPADWDDVMSRSNMHEGRRRRRLVVVAAVVFVVVLGAASALAVRTILSAQGIVGLAPEGAIPSTPKRGELVLEFLFNQTPGDPGRFGLSMYADGRLVWERIGDNSRTDEYRNSTGLLERRLTPEGVELVKAEVISTGLVDHDLHLQSGKGPYFAWIDFRDGDRLVHVIWGDIGDPYSDEANEAREMPTPEQASALIRLEERLADPDSWLPMSAWADPEVRAYVPSGYSVCLDGKKGLGLSRVLALLPPKAEDLLRAQENTPGTYTNLIGTFVLWCSQLKNEEARALERILDDAGLRGSKSVFGLKYGVVDIAYADATEFSLTFNPMFPDQG